MGHNVTEAIWHFSGYLHITTLLNLNFDHYAGAGIYDSDGYRGTNPPPQTLGSVSQLGDASGVRGPNELSETASFRAQLPAQALATNYPIGPGPFPGVVFPTNLPAQYTSQLPGDVFGEPLRPITAIYFEGSNQGNVLVTAQRNTLSDDDAVVDGLSISTGPSPIDTDAAIADLIVKVANAVPIAAAPPPTDVSGITLGRIWASGKTTEILPGGIDDEIPSDFKVAANGTFVDGVKTSDTGSSIESVAEEIATMARSILEEGDIGEPRDATGDPATDGSAAPNTANAATGSPTSASSQTATAGGNEAVNAAVLYDLGQAFGSRIVIGDVHQTNIIVQINALQDDDVVTGYNTGTLPLAQSTAGPENFAINTASFTTIPGQVTGSLTLGGFASAVNWHVDYIYGDLFDITTLTQHNDLRDNDYVSQTLTTGTYVLSTGGNDAINLTTLFEIGTAYDLIVIAGDLKTFNGIYQYNIVLDSDYITQWSTAIDGGIQSTSFEGNQLTNTAGIVNIGGGSYQALTADARAIADDLEAQSPIIDGFLTAGLPGNGTDTLKILYVTGDYYDYNIVLQTNVISDVDQIEQSFERADVGGSGGFGLGGSQFATAGGNSAANGALIVNYDSQSDFQFVGGEVYEDVILIQANFISDDDDISGQNDLHADVVAAIAASVDDDTGHLPENYYDAFITQNAGDVLGSMLH